MNKQEFISRVRSDESKLGRIIFLWIGGTGLWIAFVAIADYATNGNNHDARIGSSGLSGVVTIICAVWFLVFMLCAVAAGLKQIKCPHCQRYMNSIPGQIAVATGFCGYCGEQIFEQTFHREETKG